MRTLLVLGAGGHGKAVADSALSGQEWQRVVFADDRWPALQGCFNTQVVSDITEIGKLKGSVHGAIAAVGDNRRRQAWTASIESAGLDLVSILHPRSVVSNSATIHPGCAIMANAVIGTDAVIGRGAIVNAGAIVDHDASLGEFAHLGVGVLLAGGVSIGAGAWLQAGCCAGYSVVVEENSVIAPGTPLSVS